jgi:hypothetical protein
MSGQIIPTKNFLLASTNQYREDELSNEFSSRIISSIVCLKWIGMFLM